MGRAALLLIALLLAVRPVQAADVARGRQLIETGSFEQAFYELLPLAEAQDPAAQYLVGGLYLIGRGVPQDPAEARKWMIRAAHNGHAEASMALGDMAAKGFGGRQDAQQSLFWYRKAAEQGVAAAQNNLGIALAQGKGVSRDLKSAALWLERAAKQGNGEAQFNLAQLLQSGGPHLKADAERALTWYAVAARNGMREAEKPGDLLTRQLGRKGKLALAEAQRFTAKSEKPGMAVKPEPEPKQKPNEHEAKPPDAPPANSQDAKPQDARAYPPLPPARKMSGRSYKIQLATAANQAEAARQASKLRFEQPELLGGLEVSIVFGESGFTALMGPFATADAAEAMCAKLSARNVKTCSPVPP